MTSPKEVLSKLHEICYRVNSVANAFLKLGSDESSCFGFIQAKTSRQSTLSKKAELSVAIMNDQLWRSEADTLRYLVEGEFFMLPG